MVLSTDFQARHYQASIKLLKKLTIFLMSFYQSRYLYHEFSRRSINRIFNSFQWFYSFQWFNIDFGPNFLQYIYVLDTDLMFGVTLHGIQFGIWLPRLSNGCRTFSSKITLKRCIVPYGSFRIFWILKQQFIWSTEKSDGYRTNLLFVRLYQLFRISFLIRISIKTEENYAEYCRHQCIIMTIVKFRILNNWILYWRLDCISYIMYTKWFNFVSTEITRIQFLLTSW